jgi:hypothetical protein
MEPPMTDLMSECEVVTTLVTWVDIRIQQRIDADLGLLKPDRAVNVGEREYCLQVHESVLYWQYQSG